MGNCTIVVHAVGAHHNKDKPSDLDRMAADFVKAVKLAGHKVEHASITYGGRLSISSGPGGDTTGVVWPQPGDA